MSNAATTRPGHKRARTYTASAVGGGVQSVTLGSDDTSDDISISATMRALREESEEWSDADRAWFRHPISILDDNA